MYARRLHNGMSVSMRRIDKRISVTDPTYMRGTSLHIVCLCRCLCGAYTTAGQVSI